MIFLTAALLIAAQPASVAPATSTAAAPAQSQAALITQALTRMGFSSAGAAILLQPLDTPAERDAMIAGLRQANAAIAVAADAKPFDFAGFDKAIRDRQMIRANVENRRAAQWSKLVRELPAADRPLFARSLLPRAPAATPAPAAK